MTREGLGRAALVVSAGILLSRLLGFVRDVVMAGLLGVSVQADLYAQAFLIPDYLFFLLAGGYLSITLVPILSRHHAEGDAESAHRSFTAVFRFVGVVLAAMTVASILAAAPITSAVFPQVEQQVRLAGLTRIALGSQVFFGLGALLMAAQYARQRFLIPSLAPIVYNAGIILGGLVGAAAGDPTPEAFLWGGLAGALVGNFALQWWGAHRAGIRLVGGVEWRHPAIGEYFGLALPLMVGQSVVALDEQWPRVFGQFIGDDATAALFYARRLNMLPVGVIAQAAGVAAYPFLARLFAEGRRDTLLRTVNRSVRIAVAAGLLATGVLVALAGPVVRVAFQRGEFTAADTAFVAPLLAVYALSIPFWAAHQVYTRAFYSMRRMWVPVVIGTGITLATVPALLVAARSGAAPAVAAVSTGSIAVYTVAVAGWWHRSQSEPVRGTLGSMLRAVAAAGTAYLAARMVLSLLGGPGVGAALTTLVVGSAAAAAAYLIAARLLRLEEGLDLLRSVRRRR